MKYKMERQRGPPGPRRGPRSCGATPGDRIVENIQYYEKHRNRLLASKAKKVQCECGMWNAKSNLCRHRKSARHEGRVKAGKVIARFMQNNFK